MASLHDLAGAPELIHWLKRTGAAPRGGLLTATPAAAASRFGIVQVSGLADGKGFYVVGAYPNPLSATGPHRLKVSLTSGLITENLVNESAAADLFGTGPSTVSAQSGRTAVTPAGGFPLRLIPAGTQVNHDALVPLAFPLYVPPGGVAAVVIDGANLAAALSLAWVEVP